MDASISFQVLKTLGALAPGVCSNHDSLINRVVHNTPGTRVVNWHKGKHLFSVCMLLGGAVAVFY